MAFSKQIKHSKIQLRLEAGANVRGEMTYKNVSYNRVSEAASDEDIQAVGEALGKLQGQKVAEIMRIDEQVLTNQ